MDSFIGKCIVAGEVLSDFPVRKLLRYPHPVTVFLLDIKALARKIETQGRKFAITKYLSGREQLTLETFASEKRKNEWLGGRIAAKYAAAGLFEKKPGKHDILHLPDLAISAAKNGRPFLIADSTAWKQGDIPDISISHSGSLAAAMATGKGFCGVDIQKITPKVIKVQERFCTPAEKLILQASFPWLPEMKTAALTKLWAAKETLRKVSNLEPLPGFLEMELLEIHQELSQKRVPYWIFVCSLKRAGRPVNHKYGVFITLVKDYVLALTARDDNVW
jgi:phosphopantetheinyl transferase